MQYKRDLEKIRRWCIRRKLERGWKVTDICKHVHISRMSFYRYWSRYKKEGLDGLKDRSKRPHTIHKIDKNIEQKVIQLRKKYQVLSTQDTGNSCKSIQHKGRTYDHIQNFMQK